MVGCICSLLFHPQHMVGCLWSLWFDLQHLVVHVHNPSTWEVELGESGVQGRIQGLPRLCETSFPEKKY